MHKHELVMARENDPNPELEGDFVMFFCLDCKHRFYIEREDMRRHLSGSDRRPLTMNNRLIIRKEDGWSLISTLIN